VRAVRPSDRRGNLGARFTIKIPRGAPPGPHRLFERRHPAPSTAPARRRLRTSNGSIRVQDLAGSLDAQDLQQQRSNSSILRATPPVHSSNGHIRAEGLRGSLDANTSNGSIEARIGEAAKSVRLDTSNAAWICPCPPASRSDLRVSTSNSSITVRMPHEPNARLVAHTSNSSITSDFEIRMQGNISKNHVEGALGSGGALIDLGTSNGSIRPAADVERASGPAVPAFVPAFFVYPTPGRYCGFGLRMASADRPR